jgi:hypothetical protein
MSVSIVVSAVGIEIFETAVNFAEFKVDFSRCKTFELFVSECCSCVLYEDQFF